MAVSRDLRGSRRDLALVFADGEWRTANEAARAMGRPTGSIFGVLRRMHGDGLLEADAETPTRGTQYRLTANGHAAVAGILAEERPPGRLGSGAWLVTVERVDSATLTDFQEVLTDPAKAGDIAWAAPLGWGWLLILEESSDGWPAQRLAAAFEQRGFRCRYGTPEAILSGAQLRARASALVGGLGAAR